MPRIKMSIMELEPREQFIRLGGVKQHRARALFIGLLPPGETCYTASEVVKHSLPGREDHELYLSHYKALDNLARVHGIGQGKNPGPDNIDPVTGRRPPGKRSGTTEPCRWKRESWLAIVSDEMYEWLLELNQKRAVLAQNQPPGTVYWCDLETFEISAEIPAEPPPAPADEEEPAPEIKNSRWHRSLIAAMGGLAAAVLLAVILWASSRPAQVGKVAILDVENYLKQNKPQQNVNFPTSFSGDRMAEKWKASKFHR